MRTFRAIVCSATCAVVLIPTAGCGGKAEPAKKELVILCGSSFVPPTDRLIADYPDSPQATALRDQLPRLRERAEESARQVRKRRVRWE